MRRPHAGPSFARQLHASWQRASLRQRTVAIAALLLAMVLVMAAAGRLPGGWLGPDPRHEQLRVRAEQALRAGHLTAADGSGARELFEAALAIQPDRAEAREGLARVALLALAQAQGHARAGREAQARALLALARELDAPRAGVQAVDALLRDRRAGGLWVDAMLARAATARREGRLDGDPQAALPLYQQVLAIHPRNQRAVEGREDAITELLQPAQVALRNGDGATVADLVRRAEAFDPGHVDLPDLRGGLARLQEAPGGPSHAPRVAAPDPRGAGTTVAGTAPQAEVDAARRCQQEALRDNRLRASGECLEAWRRLAPADAGLPDARRRLAQRWVAVGTERLEAGALAGARQALGEALALDPQAPGVPEFAQRVAKAQ